MIKYKLLNQNMTSHNGFKWQEGKEYINVTPGNEMCSNQVFHFYDSPTEAVLFNPIHANINNPICYQVECDEVAHDGLKGGAKNMRLIKEVPLPYISIEKKVEFAIYCALEIYKESGFVKWANDWLSGKNRSAAAARAAARSAAKDADAARSAAVWATAVWAADAAKAADAAVWAADAAVWAAAAAIWTTADAARAADAVRAADAARAADAVLAAADAVLAAADAARAADAVLAAADAAVCAAAEDAAWAADAAVWTAATCAAAAVSIKKDLINNSMFKAGIIKEVS